MGCTFSKPSMQVLHISPHPLRQLTTWFSCRMQSNKKIMGRERDVNATAPCMGPPLLQHCFPTGASGHRLPGLCHSETHDIERALETKSCKPFTMERLAHSMHTESPGDITPTPKNQSIISPPLWGGGCQSCHKQCLDMHVFEKFTEPSAMSSAPQDSTQGTVHEAPAFVASARSQVGNVRPASSAGRNS